MIDPAYLEQIGVFFDDADKTYKRHRIRTTNIEWDESDPKGKPQQVIAAYDEELVPFPVVMPQGLDARSIARAQAEAATLQHDFYHPTYGWLRWGRKPERDHPENLGAGSVNRERRRVTVAPPKKGT
jgi:hypothetical protein